MPGGTPATRTGAYFSPLEKLIKVQKMAVTLSLSNYVVNSHKMMSNIESTKFSRKDHSDLESEKYLAKCAVLWREEAGVDQKAESADQDSSAAGGGQAEPRPGKSSPAPAHFYCIVCFS
jgi:hypothetical protein